MLDKVWVTGEDRAGMVVSMRSEKREHLPPAPVIDTLKVQGKFVTTMLLSDEDAVMVWEVLQEELLKKGLIG